MVGTMVGISKKEERSMDTAFYKCETFKETCDTFVREYNTKAWKKLKAHGVDFWSVELAGDYWKACEDLWDYLENGDIQMIEETKQQLDEIRMRDEWEQLQWEDYGKVYGEGVQV